MMWFFGTCCRYRCCFLKSPGWLGQNLTFPVATGATYSTGKYLEMSNYGLASQKNRAPVASSAGARKTYH